MRSQLRIKAALFFIITGAASCGRPNVTGGSSALASNATTWMKQLECKSNQGSNKIVIDFDATGLGGYQAVVTGEAAVAYIAAAAKGPSVAQPQNFRLYENGYKLVISALEKSVFGTLVTTRPPLNAGFARASVSREPDGNLIVSGPDFTSDSGREYFWRFENCVGNL